jgi:hypothetical protein
MEGRAGDEADVRHGLGGGLPWRTARERDDVRPAGASEPGDELAA